MGLHSRYFLEQPLGQLGDQISGVLWPPDESSGASIFGGRWTTKETNKQVISEDLNTLHKAFEAYLDLAAELLAANEAKTNLKFA